jgi:hypothetical protein
MNESSTAITYTPIEHMSPTDKLATVLRTSSDYYYTVHERLTFANLQGLPLLVTEFKAQTLVNQALVSLCLSLGEATINNSPYASPDIILNVANVSWDAIHEWEESMKFAYKLDPNASTHEIASSISQQMQMQRFFQAVAIATEVTEQYPMLSELIQDTRSLGELEHNTTDHLASMGKSIDDEKHMPFVAYFMKMYFSFQDAIDGPFKDDALTKCLMAMGEMVNHIYSSALTENEQNAIRYCIDDDHKIITRPTSFMINAFVGQFASKAK